MSKATTKTLVPKLRFSEFRGAAEWVLLPIGEEIDFLSGYAFQGSSMSENSSGIKLLRGINLTEGVIRHNQTIDRYYAGSMDNLEKYRVKENDLVIAMDGSKVGKNVALITQSDAGSLLVQRVARLRSDCGTSIQFIFQLINSLRFQTYVERVNTSSGIPHISAKQINGFQIYFPKPVEQKKIADCLSSLDELITAHCQKHEALKAHKKCLMQQLFPTEGNTVPKLRFPEFQDAEEWKIKYMEKLFTIGNGKDHKHLPDGDIPVYGSGGYMRSVNEYLYEGESACIGRKGTIDKPIFLSGKFWTVDTLFYTHSFKDCLPKFVYLIFQNVNWRSHNEAGGVPSLSKANINKIEVACPKPVEQQKIVDCLSSIDELITSQTEKIESLKVHKKGLMQQLFPPSNEVNG